MKIKLKYSVVQVHGNTIQPQRVYLHWKLPDDLDVERIKLLELYVIKEGRNHLMSSQTYHGILEANPFLKRHWWYCLPLHDKARKYYIRVNVYDHKPDRDFQGTRTHLPTTLYISNNVTVDPNSYLLCGRESED